MNLYIIRHGQSERNATRSGPFDCNLTEKGYEQAERAGVWLKDKGIQTMYCSPSIRTLQTAQTISRHVGVRPIAWADIVEWGYLFDSPGLTGKEMRTTYPEIEIGEEFADDVPWIAHKTDETWSELYERAEKCMKKLLEDHPPGSGSVALVSHAHFTRYFLSVVLDYPEVEGLGGIVQHYNCGITRIQFTEDGTRVWYVNAHGHLEGLISD